MVVRLVFLYRFSFENEKVYDNSADPEGTAVTANGTIGNVGGLTIVQLETEK